MNTYHFDISYGTIADSCHIPARAGALQTTQDMVHEVVLLRCIKL